MRTILISLAAASTLAIAAPAAAQWMPQPQPSPYGYGGYGNYGAGASLQARIARIRGQIVAFDREGLLSPGHAQHFFNETRALDSRVREESYEGDGRELNQVEERIEGLERQVRYVANENRYRYRGYGNRYGDNGYYGGGDRDDHHWGDRNDGDDGDGD